jgi:hypothetical protein
MLIWIELGRKSPGVLIGTLYLQPLQAMLESSSATVFQRTGTKFSTCWRADARDYPGSWCFSISPSLIGESLQLRAEESERVVNHGHNLDTTDCDPVLKPGIAR